MSLGGRHDQLLEQWAFFDSVLDGLTSSEEWVRKKLISGPLVTNFVASAYEEPGLEGRDAGVYIEFMAEGSRKSLCAKVYDSEPPRQLQELQRTFATLLPENEYTRARVPSDQNSTCTVARHVLPPDATPDEVREEVQRIRAVLEASASVKFREALIDSHTEGRRR